MRRWSRGTYADHTDRTRRGESPGALSCYALRRRAPHRVGRRPRSPADARAEEDLTESNQLLIQRLEAISDPELSEWLILNPADATATTPALKKRRPRPARAQPVRPCRRTLVSPSTRLIPCARSRAGRPLTRAKRAALTAGAKSAAAPTASEASGPTAGAKPAAAPTASEASGPYRGCEVSRGPYRERSERPYRGCEASRGPYRERSERPLPRVRSQPRPLPRARVAIGQPERPSNGFEVHPLDDRVVP